MEQLLTNFYDIELEPVYALMNKPGWYPVEVFICSPTEKAG